MRTTANTETITKLRKRAQELKAEAALLEQAALEMEELSAAVMFAATQGKTART
jgi:hypothetical protein